jgi:SAM-dependent methyltransferase
MAAPPPIQTAEVFIDSLGHPHRILPGHYRSLFEHEKPRLATDSGYHNQPASYMAGVRKRVDLGRGLLRTLSGKPTGPILVVGAGDGAECVWLHALDQTEVIGLDLRPVDSIDNTLWDQCRSLLNAEDRSDTHPHPDRVSLLSDDITKADLGDNHFGAIYSWQTFEHILDPACALDRMAALLAPGGLAYIEYNPFYSIDGAHWCGTVDLPWAHARLSSEDLDRAIQTLHPGRPDWSASFVQNRINRMTHADLLKHAAMAGLELEAFLPRVRTEDVMLLDHDTLQAIRRMDNRPTMADLTSRMVRVVFRKA